MSETGLVVAMLASAGAMIAAMLFGERLRARRVPLVLPVGPPNAGASGVGALVGLLGGTASVGLVAWGAERMVEGGALAAALLLPWVALLSLRLARVGAERGISGCLTITAGRARLEEAGRTLELGAPIGERLGPDLAAWEVGFSEGWLRFPLSGDARPRFVAELREAGVSVRRTALSEPSWRIQAGMAQVRAARRTLLP